MQYITPLTNQIGSLRFELEREIRFVGSFLKTRPTNLRQPLRASFLSNQVTRAYTLKVLLDALNFGWTLGPPG